MTPSDASDYEAVRDIGQLYDAVRLYVERADTPFYVEQAAAADGPVLEIGCGTGRILLPIARRGVSIAGLDGSAAMLEQCARKIALETDEVRDRVSLHQADMRAFDLDRTFGLVIIPFRPMQHLVNVEDQLDALRGIHAHLRRGGRLVFDVFNPNFTAMAGGPWPEKEDTPETILPDGRTFRRAGAVTAISTTRQYSDVELAYYVTSPSGQTERLVHAFRMRWYLRYEVEHLLARCGFVVREVYGNFDRSDLSDESPEMIFVAERR